MNKKNRHGITRYQMYQNIKKKLPNPISGRILAISDIEGFVEMIDFDNSEIIETSFPEVDCQNLPFDDKSFDYVISDQVLEHITDPQKAISEAHRVLKNDGVVIHTTVFTFYYHPSPIDYWRFSPDALEYLHRQYSNIILCGSWGNRLAYGICMLGDRFASLPIPNHKYSIRHLLATWNESRYPIVTYVMAKK
ncbi:similar to Methylase involved in ubiquinone/menaquinone biosynthesis [hydrothermal vent metagenome]|uniref:Similar to Methylase involved in ubiquinone/menaquinone biosynthesis n=1 Tax=hydrothermal vent metagenome TaxID=652676 RepID=A0A1W1E0L7_9ZZZZ